MSFSVPRAEDELELAITLAGHEPIVELVVPKTDGRLKLTLRPKTRPGAQGKPTPTPGAASSRGFRRFD